MRCPQNIEAGAYVIGALSPPERYNYERHLAVCAECRYEVAQLAGLPGLLGRLDARTAASVGTTTPGAPPRVLDGVLNRARAESLRGRRRRTWERVTTLAVAACLALLVGFGVTTFIQPPATTSRSAPVLAAMTKVAQEPSIIAKVAYWSDGAGGTQLLMSCAYPDTHDPGDKPVDLDLWVVPRDGGAPVKADTWKAGPGFNDVWPVQKPVKGMGPSDISRLEVRMGSTVVLTYQVA
jgi:hypothetical protein